MKTAKMERAIIETPEKSERGSQAGKQKWFLRWMAKHDKRELQRIEIRQKLAEADRISKQLEKLTR